MDYLAPDMETATIELTDDEIKEIDEIAFAQHQDNRAAAIRDLLDEWIKTRN
jgi:hypothetical protein